MDFIRGVIELRKPFFITGEHTEASVEVGILCDKTMPP